MIQLNNVSKQYEEGKYAVDHLNLEIKDGEIFGDAYKVLESSAYTPEELLEYYRYQQKEEEIQTRINDAHKSGVEKGEKNAKIDTAKNLLKMGLSIEQISQATGLPVKDIEKLCK